MRADPAIAAAQRAWPKGNGGRKVVVNRPRMHMEEAAREALAPIRALHRKFDRGHEVVCHDCRNGSGDFVPWPCLTAKLAYTTEELTI